MVCTNYKNMEQPYILFRYVKFFEVAEFALYKQYNCFKVLFNLRSTVLLLGELLLAPKQLGKMDVFSDDTLFLHAFTNRLTCGHLHLEEK